MVGFVGHAPNTAIRNNTGQQAAGIKAKRTRACQSLSAAGNVMRFDWGKAVRCEAEEEAVGVGESASTYLFHKSAELLVAISRGGRPPPIGNNVDDDPHLVVLPVWCGPCEQLPQQHCEAVDVDLLHMFRLGHALLALLMQLRCHPWHCAHRPSGNATRAIAALQTLAVDHFAQPCAAQYNKQVSNRTIAAGVHTTNACMSDGPLAQVCQLHNWYLSANLHKHIICFDVCMHHQDHHSSISSSNAVESAEGQG